MYITNFRPKILLDKDPQCKPKEQFNITKLQVSEIQNSAILFMFSLPPIDYLCEFSC